MNPLGLYIHIPYCLHKCGYCDFNSHLLDEEEMASYVQALLLEMEHYAKQTAGQREVNTIFFGGGTPTTLPVEDLETLLQHCGKYFQLAPDCEITFEANPATVDPDLLKRLRAAGYNRISIGVQSFHARDLKLLDRVHTVEEIHSTVDLAREAGFDNLSMDLMFALPGQTLSLWEDNLAQAFSKNPQHLSTYNLTIEPGTAFYDLKVEGKLKMPPEDVQLATFQQTIETLKAAGFRHYEISNFARPGRECRHNLTYWNNGETLGLGAGASFYLDGIRFKNHPLPSRYIREVRAGGEAVAFREQLDSRRTMGETLMLGLRLTRGISIPQFESRFQTSFQKLYGPVVDALLEQNLITLEGGRLALSGKGLFVADSVILEFIP